MSHWVELAGWQVVAIGLSFIWSGFVRSGLGFGGAALSLPLLLMIYNEPLFYLPALGWHLLFFSLLTISTRMASINWRHIGRLLVLTVGPFAAGLFGLLNLPSSVLSLFVYSMTLIYGATYLLNRVLLSKSRLADAVCLIGGGYVSGVSLMGAPLIAAYSARHLPREQLRDTLFVVWMIMVIGKLSTFALADVDLQWQFALIALPLAGIGHWLGLKAHKMLIGGNQRRFNQIIGSGLCAVSILGLWSVL